MIKYIILFIFFPILAIADGASYGGRHEIAIDGNVNGSFRHVHHWNTQKNRNMFFDFANHDNFFTSMNDFSYVEFIDRKGNVLLHAPSPAFTKLWSYRDSYFVGISNIKLYNPYQLVVWNGDGSIIYKAHFASDVARFTSKQFSEFKGKFPKADQLLKSHYFTYDNTTYCDCWYLGVPDQIGKEAWDYLVKLKVKHPYVDSSESVSNYIDWYKYGEEPKVESGNLIVPIYQGAPIVIPLGKPTQLLRPVVNNLTSHSSATHNSAH